MKSLALGILALVCLTNTVWSADPKVTITQGEKTAKIMIGEDVFAVYNFGHDRRKPFFLPVTGPGGFELLQKAVESEKPGSLGRKVTIASESVTVEGAEGEPKVLKLGEVYEVDKIESNKLWLKGPNGWVSRSDIAPMAAVVTRMINDAPPPSMDLYSDDKYDHPHHKGIWFAVDEINEIKFWMEGSLVRNAGLEISHSDSGSATLKFTNSWLDLNDQPLLIETTTVTIHPNRLLTYDAKLTPAVEEVHLGDTKEGMFAIRMTGTMKEKSGKGPVTSSRGHKSAVEAWGRTAEWVNYVGPVNGHSFGVTIMDSPKNPWPSRYHVRDYSLFAINPFGSGAYTAGTDDVQPKHERTLKKDESLEFTYGLWVHDGNVTAEQIQAMYNAPTSWE